MSFRLCDAFCGIGGYAAGAISVGCEVGMGVEIDDRILRPFASNTRGKAVCAAIGKDEIPWPQQAPDLLVHLSPPCTALSKAWAGSSSEADVEGGLELLRFSLDLVLDKGYSNWSLENVSTITTRALLDDYVQRHPERITYATFDAADYGTPQTRVRLIASSPATIRNMRGACTQGDGGGCVCSSRTAPARPAPQEQHFKQRRHAMCSERTAASLHSDGVAPTDMVWTRRLYCAVSKPK